VILSACYALWLYRKMVFGKLEKPKLQGIQDMDYREIGIFAPLVILTLLFGFWPKPVLDMSSASVDALVAQYQTAIGKTKKAEAEARGAGVKQ
jgi:NADH-quinone oxidoreductase subunit M